MALHTSAACFKHAPRPGRPRATRPQLFKAAGRGFEAPVNLAYRSRKPVAAIGYRCISHPAKAKDRVPFPRFRLNPYSLSRHAEDDWTGSSTASSGRARGHGHLRLLSRGAEGTCRRCRVLEEALGELRRTTSSCSRATSSRGRSSRMDRQQESSASEQVRLRATPHGVRALLRHIAADVGTRSTL